MTRRTKEEQIAQLEAKAKELREMVERRASIVEPGLAQEAEKARRAILKVLRMADPSYERSLQECAAVMDDIRIEAHREKLARLDGQSP